jgi:hypothetical protein
MQLVSGGRKVLFFLHPKIGIAISKKALFSLQKRATSISFYRILKNIIGKMMAKGEQIIFDLW